MLEDAQIQPVWSCWDNETLRNITVRKFAFTHDLIQFANTEPGDDAERLHVADIVITNKAPILWNPIASAAEINRTCRHLVTTDCNLPKKTEHALKVLFAA